MIKSKKEKMVENFLLMKIEYLRKSSKNQLDYYFDKKSQTIKSVKGIMKRNFDCDISKIAIDFYDIIYSNLNINYLIKDGLYNYNFAGDTMNSFNTIKTIIRKKYRKHPELNNLLNKLEIMYHSLANFWVLPVDIGRKTIGEVSKNSKEDFMDRFLFFLEENENDIFVNYKYGYKEYFEKFDNFKDFIKKMYINNYVDSNCKVTIYSSKLDSIDECKNCLKYMIKNIEGRARLLASNQAIMSKIYGFIIKKNLY